MTSRSTLLLLLLMLAGGGAALLLLLRGGGERSPRGPSASAPGAAATPAADAAAPQLEEALVPPPRVPSRGGPVQTTVLWPLRVELELERAAYLPTEPGVAPVGSGASARLAGRIAGEDGEGVRAEIRFTHGPNEGRVLVADATGAFGATDLYPGLSVVEVSGPGILGSRREVRLRQGRDTLLNIGYGRPGTVFGRVIDTDGEPIPNAEVSFDGTKVFTDALGEFYLSSVASGQVLVEIQAEGFAAYQELARVVAGQVTPKDRMTFALEPAASVVLSVPRDVGGPGPVKVLLMPGRMTHRATADSPQRAARFPWHLFYPVEVTPGVPRRVEGLPPTLLKVHAFRSGARASERVVNLRSGREQAVEIFLEPAPRMTGRVLFGGEPVAGASVRLEAPNRVRATLGYFGEPSYFLETGVFPLIPPAAQEVETDGNGRFLLSAWSELAPVRYVEARSPSSRAWCGRLVHAGEEEIVLELEEAELGDAELVVDFPDQVQGLPVELVIDGAPLDPFVLAPGDPLRVEDLRSGVWRLAVSWHAQPVFEDPELEIDGRRSLAIPLPVEAVEGQDEEAWRRAGREFPL